MSSKNACFHKATNLAIGISCSWAIDVSIVTSLPLDKKNNKIKVSWEGGSLFSNYIGPWSSSFLMIKHAIDRATWILST